MTLSWNRLTKPVTLREYRTVGINALTWDRQQCEPFNVSLTLSLKVISALLMQFPSKNSLRLGPYLCKYSCLLHGATAMLLMCCYIRNKICLNQQSQMEVTLSKIAALENFVCRENSWQAVIQAGSSTAPNSKQIQKSLCQWRHMTSYSCEGVTKTASTTRGRKDLLESAFDFGNQDS